MSNLIRLLYAQVERRAVWILGIGIALAFVWNWRLWLRDRRQAARFQQEEQKAHNTEGISEPAPQVSILLPAWNEAQHIDACVQSLLKLRYPNKQLIICAGGSDGTLQRARQYENDRVIVLEQQAGEGKQRALRHCYQCANGEIVFLTDADCIVDDDAFERTLGPILSGQEQAATGAWRPVDRQLRLPYVRYQWSNHIYRELWMPDYAPALDGKNAAVRKEVLDDVGSFNIEAPIGTDYVLSKQLEAGGYGIRFAQSSRVQTEYPETTRTYWKQASRWFRNPVVLGAQWGDRRLVLSVLRAGVLSVILLVLPACSILISSKLLLLGWVASVIHLWLSAIRISSVLCLVNKESLNKLEHLRLFWYLPVGWLGMALGMKDAISADRRNTW